MDGGKQLVEALAWLEQSLTFDLDERVHVFELTIRALGEPLISILTLIMCFSSVRKLTRCLLSTKMSTFKVLLSPHGHLWICCLHVLLLLKQLMWETNRVPSQWR